MHPHVEKITRLFRDHGASNYGQEAVTQLEHALQAAQSAEQDGAPPALIVAALLHDIGHLLHNLPEDAPEQGIDDDHEQLGERFLAQAFPPEVVEPVRLHVAAKRYLCAVDATYHDRLSGPSRHSLRLQGGPMTPAEVAEYERAPHAEAATRLRRWDDAAKTPGLSTPDLAHYLPCLESLVESRNKATGR